VWVLKASFLAARSGVFREKQNMSTHQRHRIVQHLLVAASSLCVGVILARAMGF